MHDFESVRAISSFCQVHQTIPDRVGQRVLRGVLFMDSRTPFVISHVTYLTWLEGGTKLTSMASLLFRLRGRSPHNSPLVIGPRALGEALNQKGGRRRAALI